MMMKTAIFFIEVLFDEPTHKSIIFFVKEAVAVVVDSNRFDLDMI